jgi:hypothetical protein
MKMKKLISLVVLISSISFAQEQPVKSLTELKQELSFNYTQPQNLSKVKDQNISLAKINTDAPIPETNNQKKSTLLAILYSVALPGMGELYAGRFDSGKYFTIADGVLWGALAGLDIYGVWQRNNYKSYAEANAGVSLDGKDADYFANVSNYNSIDDYNAYMDLNENFKKVYDVSKYYWKWADDGQRREYRSMWTSSENAFNNIRFIAGALVLNRVISAINAVRLVNAYNKSLPQDVSWNISVGVQNQQTMPATLTFNFIKTL